MFPVPVAGSVPSRPTGAGSLTVLCCLVFALLAAGMGPAAAQPDAPLVVTGPHQLQIMRTAPDRDTSVNEQILFANTGDAAYSGEIWLDLHPEATELQHFFVDAAGAPLGVGGQVSRDPLPTEPVGDHVRHRVDLAGRNVSIARDGVVGLRLSYLVPSGVDTFTRGFTVETPQLVANVISAPGLAPASDEASLEPDLSRSGSVWIFALPQDEQGPFAPGDRFAFSWEERDVALTPLEVQVASAGEDPVVLTATASGGIPPYAFSWDLDGDGECNDAEGERVELEASEAGEHEATVCVTDSAAAPAQVREAYATRTIRTEGVFEGPSPWLLLLFGLLIGAVLVFALASGGFLPGGAGRGAGRETTTSLGAEPRDLLETRQRVMVAGLKELEIARKKGEVSDGVYTPLKAELKQDTVRVMREIERRKEETV